MLENAEDANFILVFPVLEHAVRVELAGVVHFLDVRTGGGRLREKKKVASLAFEENARESVKTGQFSLSRGLNKTS